MKQNYHLFTFSILFTIIAIMAGTQPANAQWTKAQNFTNGKVNVIAVKGTTLYAGTDTGGVHISTDFGLTWSAKNTGLTNKHIKDLVVKDTVIIAAIDGGFGGAIFLSVNEGVSWQEPTNNYFGVIFCIEEQGDDILAGTWYGVAKSTNNGDKWATLSTSGLPSNASVEALLVNGTTIFAAVTGGSVGNPGIYRSTDNGDTWTEKNTGIVNNNFTAMAQSGNTLFATTRGGGIYTSTNNGDSWTTANNGLTSLVVYCLFVNGNNMLAGTAGGLFLSTDNAASWTEISTGLPTNTKINAIATSGPYLVIGTDSTIWRRKTAEVITSTPQIENAHLPVSIYPNPSNGAVTVEFSQPYNVTELTVTNTIGQVVYKSLRPALDAANTLQLNIPHAAEGIYFIQLKTTEGIAAKRIVVQ